MSLTFNEFQRELRKKGVEPQVAYFLTMVYEQVGEVAKQNEEMARILGQFADQLLKFAALRQEDKNVLRNIQQRIMGKTGQELVHSVLNEPEDK